MFRIPLTRPHLTDADREAALEVLSGAALSLGPATSRLEAAWAGSVGAAYAHSLSSATAGLHLGVRALRHLHPAGRDPQRRYVALPPLTFVATAHAVLYEGLTPVFVDVDSATGLLDVASLADAAARFPLQGVISVDYAGQALSAAAIGQLGALQAAHGFWILEDASHGIGGTDGTGARIGACSYAQAAVFSLHATKNLTAAGEGGVATTNDAALADFVRRHRAHGLRRGSDRVIDDAERPWYYEVDYPAGQPGMNYRLSDVQAAIADSQLRRLAQQHWARARLAARYDAALAHVQGVAVLPPVAAPGVSARHLYVVQVAQRDGLYRHLAARGIQSQVHYTPAHRYVPPDMAERLPLPATEAFAARCLSLPFFETLTDAEQDEVIAEVLTYVRG